MPPGDRPLSVRGAIGDDKRAPGALIPEIVLPDGSLQADDIWWQAGEECAVLTGVFAACELESIAKHMEAVSAAERASSALPARVRTLRPAGLRAQLALWLLTQAVRAMPKGPEANMLGHLARFWRARWLA